MPVISTRRATTVPTAEPMVIMARIVGQLPIPGVSRVEITASAMPAMPYQTARLALSWSESPPSDRMNRTPAAT